MRGLWRHRDFLMLWAGETVSSFGSQVTVLALPLTAVVTLGASASQMGMLEALQFAPYLLLTLFAGVWLDRTARRPVLILSNLGQALLVGLVPLLALLGWLRMQALFVVAFLVGCLQVLFQMAWQAYIPTLVEREHLVEANSKLHLSTAAAGLAGPALGGLLVELFTAPLAMAADAVSFLFGGASLLLIRRRETAAVASTGRRPVWSEIRQGFRIVFGSPYLRPMLAEAATFNIFSNGLSALYVLYATRELGLRPGVIGAIFTAGGIAWLCGSLLAGQLSRRFGVGPAMLIAYAAACTAPLFVALAAGPPPVVLGCLLAWSLLSGIGLSLSNIQVVSLRQSVIPAALFGRANAAYRLIISGSVPLGPLLAGYLGDRIGLRPALAVCAAGTLAALPWVLFSAIPRLRRMPEPAAKAEA